MENNTLYMLLEKITNLATTRQQPFIILENPRYKDDTITKPRDPFQWSNPLVAMIGDASCTFGNFSVSDLTEVYASLRSQLEFKEKGQNVEGP